MSRDERGHDQGDDQASPSRPAPGASKSDPLLEELRALRDVAPPASLVARVMTRVAAPQPFSLWRWLRRPVRFEVRLSALTVLAMGLVLTVSATALIRGVRSSSQAQLASEGDARAPVAARNGTGTRTSKARVLVADDARGGPDEGAQGGSDDSEPVLVRFVFEARGARRVAVAGSFNAWKEEILTMEDAGSDGPSVGVFVTTLAVPRGTHEYMFVVDGRWIADPLATERRPDGFGRQNSLLRL